MNMSRWPYSADVDPIDVTGSRQGEFQIVESRYGTPIYEQLEDDFEEAMRVAKAYIDWEVDRQTDA
jgi:hypothetical protein